MKSLVQLFRRETSSKEFIPEIDGLRFLAIIIVVLFHINAFIGSKSAALNFTENSLLSNQRENIFIYGHQGVQLFFVISGFILAIPFMRFYFGFAPQKPKLRTYFLRRLTRLEPPYVLSLVLLFFLTVLVVQSKYSLDTLIISFFASLFYLHNIVFPGELPFINGVTWSLEVEVQYYIVAPFIVWSLCQFSSASLRRLATLILIIIFSLLSWLLDVYWSVKTISLAFYLQYFLSGILLCDFYLLHHASTAKITNRLQKIAVFILGIILLYFIVGVEHAKTANLGLRIASPLMIFAFYVIVFWHDWWRRIFSFNFVTLIGGMCYTIYLLHYAIISAVGRVTVTRFYFANFDLYFAVQTAIFLIAILLVSAIYFLLVEKPCMKKDWHLRFYQNFKSFRAVGENAS